MNIGFIGLGTMGYPIAMNIAKKNKVNIFNRTISKSNKHSNDYKTIVKKSIQDLFDDSDVIFTCVSTSNILNNILKDIKNNGSKKYLIDCTSGNPDTTIIIHNYLKEINIEMLDSPISGGPDKALKGNLCSMVGGNFESFNILKDILLTFSNPIYVGEIGSAHALKAINNILNVSQLCMATEAIKSLEKYNITFNKACEVINNSSGRSLMTQERIPKDIINERYNYGFKTGLMKKDVKIALEIIGENNIMFGNILNLLDKSEFKYGEYSDYTNISKLFLE